MKRLKRPSWTQLAGVPFVMTTHSGSVDASLSDGVGVVYVSSQVPSLRKASGGTYVAFSAASMRCALPIQERDAAGMATDTRWPAPWRASTRGRT